MGLSVFLHLYATFAALSSTFTNMVMHNFRSLATRVSPSSQACLQHPSGRNSILECMANVPTRTPTIHVLVQVEVAWWSYVGTTFRPKNEQNPTYEDTGSEKKNSFTYLLIERLVAVRATSLGQLFLVYLCHVLSVDVAARHL